MALLNLFPATFQTHITSLLGRPRASLGALGLLGLAFGLRVYRLTHQNIWWDEGWTLWMARLDPVSIALRTASDEHPPLHYWLMHYWVNLAGGAALTGRLFSVFFGLLMIAVFYRVARHVGGVGLGLTGMLLLTLARFHIWWSQDIKNYTLAGLFALISLWSSLLLFSQDRPRPPVGRVIWIGYVLASTLALYSHYLAGLIFLTNNLFAGIRLISQWWAKRAVKSDVMTWSLAQLTVLGLFAPWAYSYLSNASSWNAEATFDFGFFIRVTTTVFALGETVNIERLALPVMLFSGLTALGAVWLYPRAVPRQARPQPGHHADGALLALIMILVAPLLIYALSLTPAAVFAPKIKPRYLLIFLPGYLLLLALGVTWLGRLWRSLGRVMLGGVLVMQLGVLNPYFQSRTLHDDYFSLTNTINNFSRPGDLILLYTDQEWPTFLYYVRADVPWRGVTNLAPLSRDGAVGLVSDILQRHAAVWLVTTPSAQEIDPHGALQRLISDNWPSRYERAFGDKRLALYAAQERDLVHVPAESFQPQRPVFTELGASLRLTGVDLACREASAGDTFTTTTYWDLSAPVSVTIELRNSDHQPVSTTSAPLSAGARVRLQSDVYIPATATGEYAVVVRGPTAEATLAQITVRPRPSLRPVQAISYPTNYQLGDSLQLAGYDLSTTVLRPGEQLPLTLFWRATQRVSSSYKVFVQLVGQEWNPAQDNPLWGQVDQLPVNNSLPTTAWELGQVIPDDYRVPLAGDAPGGEYQLIVGLYDPITGQRLRVQDRNGQDLGDAITLATIQVP